MFLVSGNTFEIGDPKSRRLDYSSKQYIDYIHTDGQVSHLGLPVSSEC